MRRLAIVATHPIQYYAPWFRRLAERDGLELRVFYLWDFGVRPSHDPGFGSEIAWDVPLLDGYTHEFVPNTAADPGTHHFRGLRNPGLLRRVLEWKPDAVLLMAYRYTSTLGFILRAPRRLPLLFRGDSHRLGAPPINLREMARRAAISMIFSRFAAVLSVGSANREYFLMHGVKSDRIFHAPHAVDVERLTRDRDRTHSEALEWRRSLGIGQDCRVILFAGKFQEVKRPLDLLRAYRQGSPPRSALLFVGSGVLEPHLRREAEGVAGVFFSPFQNQAAMPRVLSAADIVVLPSRSETWGLILNEAMCLGKPLIVSDRVGAGPDLVEDGRNGIVYPAGNVEALSGALQTALADDSRLAEWGRRSVEISANFTYEKTTQGLLEALEAILPGGGMPS